MKGFIAFSFVLLAVAVSGKPGGYTANNDVLNLKLDDSAWADAKRAGELLEDRVTHTRKPRNLSDCP